MEKPEHAGTASGVEKCLKMAIGLKNTTINYQLVAFWDFAKITPKTEHAGTVNGR